jgi:hypothetical protein
MIYLNYSFWDCSVKCKGFTADFRLFSGVQGLAEIKRLSVYGASQRFSAVSSLSSISYND